ncbi:hypothetical protein [Arcobacter sp. YIC-80]|uniref:hypothetical protein n=1 Tax=unclassified Arcobacter TaxID=2593671 RepID=UPI003851633E
MRINNNTISTPNQADFNRQVRSTQQVEQANSSKIGNAYSVSISNWAKNIMSEFKDEEIAIFNSDVLSYNSNLDLTLKQKV